MRRIISKGGILRPPATTELLILIDIRVRVARGRSVLGKKARTNGETEEHQKIAQKHVCLKTEELEVSYGWFAPWATAAGSHQNPSVRPSAAICCWVDCERRPPTLKSSIVGRHNKLWHDEMMIESLFLCVMGHDDDDDDVLPPALISPEFPPRESQKTGSTRKRLERRKKPRGVWWLGFYLVKLCTVPGTGF